MRVCLGFWVIVIGAAHIILRVHWTGAGVPVILLVSLALFHSLTVRVSRNDIVLWFGIGLIRKSFVSDDIQSATIVHNRWYNGWGIKKIRGGWLYNVSGFDAVEIQLKNDRRYRIGTDQPRELLAAIESVTATSS
tara:strand:- start:893 stop:1297 length:405 start_codon:yes stop_codon:yes gene_type:complete